MEGILENIEFIAEKNEVSYKDKIRLKLSASINGKIREVFIPETWDEAHRKGERKFILKYLVKIKKKELFSSKDLVKDKIVRKAVLFWTRNPTIDKRIWVMLVLEDQQPILIRELDEIHERLFSLNKLYEIDAKDLGIGKHKIQAEISARWSNYTFTKKTVLKTKKSIEIECKDEKA